MKRMTFYRYIHSLYSRHTLFLDARFGFRRQCEDYTASDPMCAAYGFFPCKEGF